MINQEVYLDKYDWTIYCYYAVDCYYVDEIMDTLKDCGATMSILKDAYSLMKTCAHNTGFTYSNCDRRISVVIICLTDCAEEFINSFVHEIAHVSNHIARTFNINLNSEEVCYIAGDLSEKMYLKSNKLFCNCCRR